MQRKLYLKENGNISLPVQNLAFLIYFFFFALINMHWEAPSASEHHSACILCTEDSKAMTNYMYGVT